MQQFLLKNVINGIKHFKLERSDVEEHVARIAVLDQTYVIPESILEWPAHGDPTQGQDEYLAPFFDLNGNGQYEPEKDYPDYNITGTNDDAKLFGDQTLFWIFNDKGNIHTETEAEPLGLEIHAQAFGFAADNEEVNDMTFYNYKIINRSTLPLNDTYFGQWVDPDLGYYLDDYVGCDVGLGLGFVVIMVMLKMKELQVMVLIHLQLVLIFFKAQ